MLHNVCVCVFNSICVCVFERLEKKRRGTQGGIKRKKRRMKRGVKGWGWKESGSKKKEREKRLTGPVCTCTHHPLQLESLTPPHPPLLTIHHPPFLMFTVVGEWNNCTHHCSSDGIEKKKREISSAWNAFSYSFFPLMLLLLVFVQWFA